MLHYNYDSKMGVIKKDEKKRFDDRAEKGWKNYISEAEFSGLVLRFSG